MRAEDEAPIRALLERRVEAMRGKDAEAAIAVLDPDVTVFEMVPPLVVPAAHVRDRAAAQAWLDSWEEGPEVEIRDLRIHVSGDVAFAYSLNRLSGTRRNGTATNIWIRSTLGLAKSDGEWRIVHAHSSVPFHADGSFRAALDLEP